MEVSKYIVQELYFPTTLNGDYRTLTVKNDLLLKYKSIPLKNYSLTFNLKGSTIHPAIGCKNPTKEEIFNIIAFLEGKAIEIKAKKLVKKTNADTKYLKTAVIDESKDFFIMSTKKVYSKKDYEIREVVLVDNHVKYADRWGYKKPESTAEYVYFGDHLLCKNTVSDKAELLAKANYILEILNEFNKFNKPK